MRKIDFYFPIIAIFVLVVSLLNSIEGPEQLEIQTIKLDSIHKIIEITDSLVVPVLYDTLMVDQFSMIPDRKKQFINQVLPAILIVRFELEKKSQTVEQIIRKIERNEPLEPRETAYADSLLNHFRAQTYENLLERLKPHPNSLVLAQAALESGWGLSRLAIEGNNLFGVISSSTDPRSIEMLYIEGKQRLFFKRYDNILESIDHYFLTIGRHNAYKRFRQNRYRDIEVLELIKTLDNYSESDEYIFMLKKMIEWNSLTQYDNYIIDPKFITKKTLLKEWTEILLQKNDKKK